MRTMIKYALLIFIIFITHFEAQSIDVSFLRNVNQVIKINDYEFLALDEHDNLAGYYTLYSIKNGKIIDSSTLYPGIFEFWKEDELVYREAIIPLILKNKKFHSDTIVKKIMSTQITFVPNDLYFVFATENPKIDFKEFYLNDTCGVVFSRNEEHSYEHTKSLRYFLWYYNNDVSYIIKSEQFHDGYVLKINELQTTVLDEFFEELIVFMSKKE